MENASDRIIGKPQYEPFPQAGTYFLLRTAKHSLALMPSAGTRHPRIPCIVVVIISLFARNLPFGWMISLDALFEFRYIPLMPMSQRTYIGRAKFCPKVQVGFYTPALPKSSHLDS